MNVFLLAVANAFLAAVVTVLSVPVTVMLVLSCGATVNCSAIFHNSATFFHFTLPFFVAAEITLIKSDLKQTWRQQLQQHPILMQ